MYYVVDIPWGFHKPESVKYNATRKIYYYQGTELPRNLRDFQPPQFSREQWQEDDLNNKVTPIAPGESVFHPKPHQSEAGKKIAASYHKGWSGFLIADKTGVGKTLSALTGIGMIAKLQGKTKDNRGTLLIVCPKSVIPQWRQTIHNFRAVHPLLRIIVMNYQQLQKLLEAAPVAKPAKGKTKVKVKKARQVARTGKPIIDFDYIIFDESQQLKNYPSSNVSLMAEKVAGLDKVYRKGKSPFTLFSSATPGSSPLNFALMSGFLSKLINPKVAKNVTPSQWGAFLMEEGFAVTKGKSGYNWAPLPWGIKDPNPTEKAAYDKSVREAKARQRVDAQRIGRALTKADAPFIMRSPKNIAGWPEQQIVALPIELDAKQKAWYREAWSQFRDWLNLTPAKSDPKGALVQQLRYRQKTSLLRVDSLVELAADWVDEDKQVYISLEFLETAQELREKLEKKGIVVAEASGRTSNIREQERIRFQKGLAKVMISTVVSGISLHSDEILPDGTKATSNERATILADIRQNPLDSLQALGRAHRDGMNSIAYIPYIEDSIDKKVVESFINKVINTEVMTGKSVEEAEDLERIFRVAAARPSATKKLS